MYIHTANTATGNMHTHVHELRVCMCVHDLRRWVRDDVTTSIVRNISCSVLRVITSGVPVQIRICGCWKKKYIYIIKQAVYGCFSVRIFQLEMHRPQVPLCVHVQL